MEPGDVPGAVALQRACFPLPFPEELLWSSAHLERHHAVYPEGQFVALADGQVIGSASSLRISEAIWHAHLTWDETLGGAFFENYDPVGTTLYGADISVHPNYRGKGVARALYEARFGLVRASGMVRYGTACRIPDFAGSGQTDVDDYIAAVVRGESKDRTLSPLLRMGLRAIGSIRDYMQDQESGNSAALLEWTP